MLDSTVTNLAVPNLHHDFPVASVTDLSWVISGYAVMFAAWLAPAGRVADALGRRRMFIFGMGLFTLASVACACAPSLPVLIAARLVQGAGAAAMIPASLAILLLDGPADRRANSIGIWTATSAFAAAIGPSIGGVLVDAFNWRAVFVINIPFAVVLIIAARRLLDRPATGSVGRMPDWVSTVLIALGIASVTLGVTEGNTWHWTNVKTLASLILGLVVIGLALVRSRTQPVPAVDTSLWGSRTFTVTNIVSLLYGMAQYPFMLIGVLFGTEVWHYSVLQAGLANTPGAVAASIIAIVMGRMSARLGGPRFVTIFGLVAFGACCIWLTFAITTHPAFLALWLPAAMLAGTGIGAATTGTSQAAALSAPPVRFASASGLNTAARQFGGAIGVAAMAVILQGATPQHGNAGVTAFSHVYAYCAIVLALALLVTLAFLRFTAAPAPAPARQESAAVAASDVVAASDAVAASD
jgi:EmrB/QacA subfamily drug resistance transporter